MANESPLYETSVAFSGFKMKSSVNTMKNGFKVARGSPAKTFGEQELIEKYITVRIYKPNYNL